MAGQGFHCNEGTISIHHQIIPIVGSSNSGTKDSFFQWEEVSNAEYEGIYLSSPGIRHDSVIYQTAGAIYQAGHIDCGYTALHGTKYQRPALMKLRNYDKNYSSI